MKIISFDYDSIHSTGGVSTFNRNLFKIFRDKISFFSIYKNEKGIRPDLVGCDEVNIGLYKSFLIRGINLLSGYRLHAFLVNRFLLKNKPDVVIINSPSLLRYINKSSIDKLILVQHQTMATMLSNASNFAGSKKYLLYCFDKIDHFIVLSPEEIPEWRSVLPCQYHHKIQSIRHMTIERPSFRPKVDFHKSIVMLGRLDLNQKRQDLAIELMKHLPDWTLTIYGDGPARAKLENKINTDGVSNVTMPGNISEVIDKISAFDVMLLSSDFEGYPISLIEGLSASLPLLVRDTFSSSKDIVKGNGVLVSGEWCIEECIDGLKLIQSNYHTMRECSYELSSRHDYEIISASWLSLIYNSAIKYE